MTTPKQPKPGMPPLRIPEGLQIKYSNMARISHTPSEMVFDFASMLPGIPPEVVARIVMSPIAAKLFVQAVNENLMRYEANFGAIKLPVGASDLASTLFRNVQPPSTDEASSGKKPPAGDEPQGDDKPTSPEEDSSPPSEDDQPPETPPEGAV